LLLELDKVEQEDIVLAVAFQVQLESHEWSARVYDCLELYHVVDGVLSRQKGNVISALPIVHTDEEVCCDKHD
jgi:hypothetical protein